MNLQLISGKSGLIRLNAQIRCLFGYYLGPLALFARNPRFDFRWLRTQEPLFAVHRPFCRINGPRSLYITENPRFRACFDDLGAIRSVRRQKIADKRK
ncbi:hypothetical protein B9T62_07140 [Paenibacillus donghaensis]|uniref:Uncharacterized protein n=1 Tax=Paenibacillus donghaensis TaxID=414771 RepID=A0A2Z2KL02_9BACL|nr:hypothetical protein B9T62_07140 [Paenibacillus donghaensis]